MSNVPEDLVEKGRALYEASVNQVLAGFQLIEEMLKSYIEHHFDLVRILIGDRLHFEFRREDYQDAALGRLTQVFSKLCANQKLVTDLRSMVRRRDHIAHRALLKTFETGIQPIEYSQLLDELQADTRQINALMIGVVEEIGKLGGSKA